MTSSRRHPPNLDSWRDPREQSPAPAQLGGRLDATPPRQALRMATETEHERALYFAWPGAVIEEWWCPVCHRAAHRIYRPGRPRIYCSNACRQRAYRHRRANGLRTTATPQTPCESAFILMAMGRRHALRHRTDFMANLSDGRRRRVTVCGALARPTRYTKSRHYDFLLDSSGSCRSCIQLVLPPGETAPPIAPADWAIASQRRHTHVPGSPPSFDD